ncbi:unnamed protein product [Chironomus riparius]|uniref:Uncharacterized protein n=1 Tax=Chironomus riparius TaxID=315576 RepID=A0A9N9WW98_9DIPT|nr:unnamed protein product [Chironomus riparius]
MSSSNATKSRRRTYSEDSHKQLIVKSDEVVGALKKSLSSTLELPISKNDLSTGSYDDSLEDLFNNAMTLKVANTRHYYCDIFSRQSVGSEEGNSSSPDIDDECINFLASIPNGCEIIQLIPKKPTAVIPNAMYQPDCTNIQNMRILKSSCSAFRDISEINKITKSQTDNDDNEDDGKKEEVERKEVFDGASSSSHA